MSETAGGVSSSRLNQNVMSNVDLALRVVSAEDCAETKARWRGVVTKVVVAL